jgi:hypothetical protein
MVQSKRGLHPTILRLTPITAKTLGTGFAARSVHAKPCFDCLLSVQALSGGVPLRSTFALDSLEPAARCYEKKAACLGRFSLRSLSFGSTGACGAIAQRATAQRPQAGKTQLLVIFGEGRAITKIIQDKETIEPRHHL